MTYAIGKPHIHYREIGSTNRQAKVIADLGAPSGTVITADHQTSGRGRHGRSWHSTPGSSLLLSVIVFHQSPTLTLRAGLAVAHLVGNQAQIKWPNDVQIAGRKVAGVLVEARPQADWAVIGIGINLKLDNAQLPTVLRDQVCCLNSKLDHSDLLQRLLSDLEKTLALPLDRLIEAIRNRDCLKGKQVTRDQVTGISQGINGQGELLLKLDSNETIAITSGEVTPSS